MDSLVTDNTTFITPLALGFALAMCGLLLILPRRHAFIPVIMLTCFMTMGQRLMIAGLNFPMLRILTAAGWIRILVRGELRIRQLTPIDKGVLAFAISSIVTYTLLWRTSDAFVNKCGLAYNMVGLYFLFRCLLRDFDDVVRAIRITAILIVPLAVSMALEEASGRNMFAMFGGVPVITPLRDGVLRCQGPFAHPILAGTFGATLAPLFVALWWRGAADRILSVIALAAAGVITVTAGSSGPILAFGAGMFALMFWPMREHMSLVRRSVVLMLIVLELAMKPHVWFLLAKVDIFSGSTGYHRAYLIDRAFANLGGWWLVGTQATVSWADADQHLFDVTNQYLLYGADGGLLTMILFILIIVRCFRGVGVASRLALSRDRRAGIGIWCLGAALFGHAVTFISVSYFDQNIVNWYLLLAMVSTVVLWSAEQSDAAAQPASSAGGAQRIDTPYTKSGPLWAHRLRHDRGTRDPWRECRQ